MKTKLFASLACLIFYTNAINSTAIIPDTSHKPWRISKEQFIEKYGNDDTSKALIEYWFFTQGTGYAITSLAGAGTTLFGGVAISSLIRGDGLIAAVSGIFAVPLFILLTVCVISLAQHSRKNLYRLLRGRQAGKSLPKKLQKHLTSFMKRKKLSF